MSRVNWGAYDREEEQLVDDFNTGRISRAEFDRAMRDLRDEVRGMAEEAAEEAYRDATGGRW